MPTKRSAKRAAFGTGLIEGMKLVLAHQRGKIGLEQVWPRPVDVKAIRKRVKMSQAEFSRAYGISKRALQEWEQGGRQPDSAARALSDRHRERAGRSAAGTGKRITRYTFLLSPNPKKGVVMSSYAAVEVVKVSRTYCSMASSQACSCCGNRSDNRGILLAPVRRPKSGFFPASLTNPPMSLAKLSL